MEKIFKIKMIITFLLFLCIKPLSAMNSNNKIGIKFEKDQIFNVLFSDNGEIGVSAKDKTLTVYKKCEQWLKRRKDRLNIRKQYAIYAKEDIDFEIKFNSNIVSAKFSENNNHLMVFFENKVGLINLNKKENIIFFKKFKNKVSNFNLDLQSSILTIVFENNTVVLLNLSKSNKIIFNKTFKKSVKKLNLQDSILKIVFENNTVVLLNLSKSNKIIFNKTFTKLVKKLDLQDSVLKILFKDNTVVLLDLNKSNEIIFNSKFVMLVDKLSIEGSTLKIFFKDDLVLSYDLNRSRDRDMFHEVYLDRPLFLNESHKDQKKEKKELIDLTQNWNKSKQRIGNKRRRKKESDDEYRKIKEPKKKRRRKERTNKNRKKRR